MIQIITDFDCSVCSDIIRAAEEINEMPKYVFGFDENYKCVIGEYTGGGGQLDCQDVINCINSSPPCTAISSCINTELTNIINNNPSLLPKFCEAVNVCLPPLMDCNGVASCVETQMQLIINDLPNGIPSFCEAVQTCVPPSECNYILGCVNNDLENIINNTPAGLSNFCEAVRHCYPVFDCTGMTECINNELCDYSSDLPNGLSCFQPAVHFALDARYCNTAFLTKIGTPLSYAPEFGNINKPFTSFDQIRATATAVGIFGTINVVVISGVGDGVGVGNDIDLTGFNISLSNGGGLYFRTITVGNTTIEGGYVSCSDIQVNDYFYVNNCNVYLQHGGIPPITLLNQPSAIEKRFTMKNTLFHVESVFPPFVLQEIYTGSPEWEIRNWNCGSNKPIDPALNVLWQPFIVDPTIIRFPFTACPGSIIFE